jgi:hypothetical protein
MTTEIVELLLTKLSKVPVVGDALEAMTAEAYDKLERELAAIVNAQLSGHWKTQQIRDEILEGGL